MAVNPDSIQRYPMPTDADMDRHYGEPAPVDLMHRCAHEDACLRVMGMLCFGQDGYGSGWGAEHDREMERAARWMGCGGCDCWTEV